MNKHFRYLILGFSICLFCVSCDQIESNTDEIKLISSNTPIADSYKRKDAINIKPSIILADLRKELSDKPGISAKELAKLGNELLMTKGYNFTVDLADINRSIDLGDNIYKFKVAGSNESL